MLQPEPEKVFPDLASSVFLKREVAIFMDYPGHYHPKFEIVFDEKSYRIRLMGNHAGDFRDEDLMCKSQI